MKTLAKVEITSWDQRIQRELIFSAKIVAFNVRNNQEGTATLTSLPDPGGIGINEEHHQGLIPLM